MAKHDHHHHHGAATGSETETDWAAMIELLDLDAEVLHGYLSDVFGWVHDLADARPRHRIVDVGSGTGSGTFTLLRYFADADVTALDVSEPLLARIRDRAAELGVADRVSTVLADLDAGWPAVEQVDLVWASLSLHHMADPDRVLAEILAALRPGGLLAVAEMNGFPRFLPEDIGFGRPGLEARCHAVMTEAAAHELPHIGSDWAARLRKAGYTVEAERTFDIGVSAPPPATGRYAQLSLRRIRSGLGERLDPEDVTALDALIDDDGPRSVLRRDDLTVRGTRTVWVAGRP